jgi:hypothetical protein
MTAQVINFSRPGDTITGINNSEMDETTTESNSNVDLDSIIRVQPGDDYTKIESAKAGDIVEIAPGIYQFRVRLSNHGTSSDLITIRAQDPNNPPIFDLSGDWCGDWPGSWSNNRAIFHIEGSYYKITNIVFRGAHQANNSADASGIRTVLAQNITIQECLFEFNDNGVQGSGDNILYEFCEFRYNGKIDGQTGDSAHNIYTHGGTFTFRYCYIHDPLEGQNIHSRSRNLDVECCLVEYARTYTGDIMVNGNEWVDGELLYQTLTYSGCVIKESADQINDTKAFTLYNSPARTGVYMKLNLFYNTFIGNDNNGSILRFTESGLAGHEVNMYNNIFYNKHDPVRFDGESEQTAVVQLNNNWWPEGYDYSEDSSYMNNSIFGTDPGFQDAANHNYRITVSAQVKDGANENLCAAPPYEFELELMRQGQYKVRNSAKDLGAYEYSQSLTILPGEFNRDRETNNLIIKNVNLKQNYPNPFNPKTIINYELEIMNDVDLSIYNILGKKVATLVSKRQEAGNHQVEWDGNGHTSGVYYYRLEAGAFRDVKKMMLLK